MTVKLYPSLASRFLFTVFTAVFFLSFHSAKAQTATVYGQVIDTTGRGIDGANVGYIGSTKPPVLADKNGYYSIDVPAGQKVTINFGMIGFKREQFAVQLKPGERKKIDISLEASSTTTFVLTDYMHRDIFGIVTKYDLWKYMPTATDDPLRIAVGLGASSNNELSSQYSVRGGNFDENLVYVNDFEVYRPFLTRAGQQEGLSVVNGDMIDNVFFSAGGFEPKYGDKMSSVLDFKYRRPTTLAASFTASLLGASVEVENRSKDTRLSWMLGIREKSNRYLLNKLDTRGDYTASFTDIQADVIYDFNENLHLEYLGNYAINKYQLEPQTRETEFGTLNEALKFTVYFEGQELNRFTTGFNALSLTRESENKKNGWKLIGSAYGTLEDETYDVLGQYYLDELETDFGKPQFGQVAFNRGVGGFLNHARNYLDAWVMNGEFRMWNTFGKDSSIHQLSYGIKFQNEIINDELSEWNYVDSSGYSIPHAPLETIDLQNVIKGKASLNSNRYMGFIEDTWKWKTRDSSEYTFIYGARANYWDLNNQLIISPRASLAWRPKWKANIVFKAATGLYQQPPFYRELRDLEGTVHKDVKAQTSVHALLGSDLSFMMWERPFRFIAEGYYKYLDHLVPYEVNDVRIRYFGKNEAYGYAYGLDLKINGEFVKGVDSWVNLSLMRTRENLYDDKYYILLNSDGDTIVPGFTQNNVAVDTITIVPGYIPRPTDQILTFSLFFQDYLPQLPDFKMNLGLIFGTGLPFGPPNHQRYLATFRMPPYRRVDIGFSYQIVKEKKPLPESNPFHVMKSLWAGLEVYNLLQVNNTISYYWIKDVTGRQYGVPNYLTNRQLSLKLIAKF